LIPNDDTCIGGRLRFFIEYWAREITSDPWVLELVKGTKIDFFFIPNNSMSRPNPVLCSPQAEEALDSMVTKLIKLQVVSRVSYSRDLVINPIFVVENHDGSYRLILNSSVVNEECVEYHHFRMETISEVLTQIQPGDYLASIDLVKGFYNVPLHPSHKPFFAFKWHGQYYVFNGLSMGLKEAPRIFTVIIKAILRYIRLKGFSIFAYLDDTCVKGASYYLALLAISFTCKVFQSCGFFIHPDKSIFLPTQRMKYLGYIIDTVKMTVELPIEKQISLFKQLRKLKRRVLSASPIKVRSLAKVIGVILSCAFASKYGKAHYRSLEFEKLRLMRELRDWEASGIVSQLVLPDIDWWLSLQLPIERVFSPVPISHVVTTDASTGGGWGAICANFRAAGVWPSNESYAIGLLELRAAVRALQHLPINWSGANIHFRIDNQVAISYVNKLGGRDPILNSEARVLWGMLETNHAFAHATYIPSKDNPADSLSRLMSRSQASLLDTEWKLDSAVFRNLCEEFGVCPKMDWFASQANTQLARFMSYEFDSLATGTDAFLSDWSEPDGYFFPPFCLLSRVLQKLQLDRPVSALIIHPFWPAQPWWPLIESLRSKFIQLPPSSVCLRLPNYPDLRHRLKNLKLQASMCYFTRN
jgi:hypothetical protein